MNKDKKEPKLNQFIFIDPDYKDEWDIIRRGKIHFRLLTITSQDEKEIKEKEKKFISQYEIRLLPDCLKISPSFVKIVKSKLAKLLCSKCPQGCFKWLKEKNENEFGFLVKKHEDYRNDKLNAPKQRPPIEISKFVISKKNLSRF